MKLGLAVDEQRWCKHLQTAKKMRDFVVAWCHFWARTRPPFAGVGNQKDWTEVHWEQLPMHELVIDAGGARGWRSCMLAIILLLDAGEVIEGALQCHEGRADVVCELTLSAEAFCSR
jgi:hypothetical protein